MMSILLGLLLYALAIAFLCGLTGTNRLDGPEPATRALPEEPASEPAAGAVAARSAHG
jgi:hypothetical protein